MPANAAGSQTLAANTATQWMAEKAIHTRIAQEATDVIVRTLGIVAAVNANVAVFVDKKIGTTGFA